MRNFYLFLFLSFSLVSCSIDQLSEIQSESTDIHARIENSSLTKTTIGENNDIHWSENDQIVAFMKSTLGVKYQINASYVGKTYGYFSQVTSTAADEIITDTSLEHNIVYYPYSETIDIEKSGNNYELEVVLPTEQTYAAESFGSGSFPMVAVSSDNDITFKNVCGGIKLQLMGNKKISSIKVSGNNGEKLSGAAVLTAHIDGSAPSISMYSSANSSVTLNCGEGIPLNEDTATEFIISLPPVSFTKGFVVTIIDTEGNEYGLHSGKENEVKRSSLLVMPPVDIQETGVSTRMLKLVSVGYNSYQVEITVPETVGPDGNFVRYYFGDEAMFNHNIYNGWDYDTMLLNNGGDLNTTDSSKTITIQQTLDDDVNYLVYRIMPDEPTVFIAGEYTRDGQLVGEPEIIRFKTKGPSALEADFDVEVTDISATDAEIYINPDDDISKYYTCILDDETYHFLLDNIVSERNLQWFTSSYYGAYNVGTVGPRNEAVVYTLSWFFAKPPTANTKYHILITGMGDKSGTSQCFKHVEFYTTEKQRSQGPSIAITHIPEKSTDNYNSFVFINIKCTSVDNEDAGAATSGYYQYGTVSDWEDALNNGNTYESMLENGYQFNPYELDMINSEGGYDLSIYSSTIETMRLAVVCYNDEFTPSEIVIVDAHPDNENSNINNAIDLSADGSANCYIINTGGSYKFEAIKGNSQTAINYVNSVDVLWESFGSSDKINTGDLISSASYDNGFIYFKTNDAFKEGNAVIAAKDVDNNILWSWHIWMTDQPQEHVYKNNAGVLMDRNLGALSATAYDPLSIGLLYQWGRKDPFLGLSEFTEEETFGTEAASTLQWPNHVESTVDVGTIEYSISHPTTFITFNPEMSYFDDEIDMNRMYYDWLYSSDFISDHTRWSSQKTVYDPCPPGWRVPDEIWTAAGIPVDSFSSFDEYITTDYRGFVVGLEYCDHEAWYPASGMRVYWEGDVEEYNYGLVTTYGSYWSTSIYGILYCDGYADSGSWDGKYDGHSVRCQKN